MVKYGVVSLEGKEDWSRYEHCYDTVFMVLVEDWGNPDSSLLTAVEAHRVISDQSFSLSNLPTIVCWLVSQPDV